MIRAARVVDAAAVAALHRRAREPWAAFMDAWEPPGVSVWAERLAGDEAETSVFDGGDVRGFVSVARDEVRALYVDPPSQRHGVGAALAPDPATGVPEIRYRLAL